MDTSYFKHTYVTPCLSYALSDIGGAIPITFSNPCLKDASLLLVVDSLMDERSISCHDLKYVPAKDQSNHSKNCVPKIHVKKPLTTRKKAEDSRLTAAELIQQITSSTTNLREPNDELAKRLHGTTKSPGRDSQHITRALPGKFNDTATTTQSSKHIYRKDRRNSPQMTDADSNHHPSPIPVMQMPDKSKPQKTAAGTSMFSTIGSILDPRQTPITQSSDKTKNDGIKRESIGTGHSIMGNISNHRVKGINFVSLGTGSITCVSGVKLQNMGTGGPVSWMTNAYEDGTGKLGKRTCTDLEQCCTCTQTPNQELLCPNCQMMAAESFATTCWPFKKYKTLKDSYPVNKTKELNLANTFPLTDDAEANNRQYTIPFHRPGYPEANVTQTTYPNPCCPLPNPQESNNQNRTTCGNPHCPKQKTETNRNNGSPCCPGYDAQANFNQIMTSCANPCFPANGVPTNNIPMFFYANPRCVYRDADTNTDQAATPSAHPIHNALVKIHQSTSPYPKPWCPITVCTSPFHDTRITQITTSHQTTTPSTEEQHKDDQESCDNDKPCSPAAVKCEQAHKKLNSTMSCNKTSCLTKPIEQGKDLSPETSKRKDRENFRQLLLSVSGTLTNAPSEALQKTEDMQSLLRSQGGSSMQIPRPLSKPPPGCPCEIASIFQCLQRLNSRTSYTRTNGPIGEDFKKIMSKLKKSSKKCGAIKKTKSITQKKKKTPKFKKESCYYVGDTEGVISIEKYEQNKMKLKETKSLNTDLIMEGKEKKKRPMLSRCIPKCRKDMTELKASTTGIPSSALVTSFAYVNVNPPKNDFNMNTPSHISHDYQNNVISDSKYHGIKIEVRGKGSEMSLPEQFSNSCCAWVRQFCRPTRAMKGDLFTFYQY